MRISLSDSKVVAGSIRNAAQLRVRPRLPGLPTQQQATANEENECKPLPYGKHLTQEGHAKQERLERREPEQWYIAATDYPAMPGARGREAEDAYRIERLVAERDK